MTMNPSPRQPRAPLQPGDSPDTYLLALNDALRPIGKAGDIVMTASRMLGQYLGAQRVAYFEMRGRDYFIEHDYVDGVPSLAGRHPAASFGQNLLAPQKQFFGYGSGKVIGHDYLAEVEHPQELHSIPGRTLPAQPPDIAALDGVYRAMRGLAWWRIERGPELVNPSEPNEIAKKVTKLTRREQD